MKNLFGACALLVCFVLVGCNPPDPVASAGSGSNTGGGTLLINGAGATFPYPIYSKWFDEYHKKYSNIQINYQSIGSGGGIRQMLEGTVDFGASDQPMTDEQLSQAKSDVAAYNVPGISEELNFTPAALAGIYLGKIKKWNDPELTKANPGVKLPNSEIVVVHRSDGSGTTYIWVDYLAKISPEWKEKVGVNSSVNWPVGLGGKGNEGVAGVIKNTPNSIGYVEKIYAIQTKMTYGRVQNAAGKFVKPELVNVTAAAAGAAKNMPDDFRVSITNAPGEDAYPIASFTWLLVPAKIQNEAKKKAIKEFLNWMLTDGQNLVEALSYSKLPPEVVAMEEKAIGLIE
jgi:phosphate transport system substrate-binding protein